MAERPNAETGDNAANPYAAPRVTTGQPWGTGDPECEAVRRPNLTDEAYSKFLVRANVVFAAVFGGLAILCLSFPIRHAIGQINAPWVAKLNWAAFRARGGHSGTGNTRSVRFAPAEALGDFRRNAGRHGPVDLLGFSARQS